MARASAGAAFSSARRSPVGKTSMAIAPWHYHLLLCFLRPPLSRLPDANLGRRQEISRDGVNDTARSQVHTHSLSKSAFSCIAKIKVVTVQTPCASCECKEYLHLSYNSNEHGCFHNRVPNTCQVHRSISTRVTGSAPAYVLARTHQTSTPLSQLPCTWMFSLESQNHLPCSYTQFYRNHSHLHVHKRISTGVNGSITLTMWWSLKSHTLYFTRCSSHITATTHG